MIVKFSNLQDTRSDLRKLNYFNFSTFLGDFCFVLKTLKWQKTLVMVKYEWNGSPQPQMVGFCDLVGTGIVPVSKKTAVKS